MEPGLSDCDWPGSRPIPGRGAVTALGGGLRLRRRLLLTIRAVQHFPSHTQRAGFGSALPAPENDREEPCYFVVFNVRYVNAKAELIVIGIAS